MFVDDVDLEEDDSGTLGYLDQYVVELGAPFPLLYVWEPAAIVFC
jgi:hypothetical protein